MRRFLQQALGWARDTMSPKRPSWRSASVLGMVVALVVAAVVVEGYRSAKFELDEASVWVTSGNQQIAGRINTLAHQVEVRSAVVGPGVDVLQRGREVLLVDPGKSVTAIDPATGTPAGASIELTPEISVAAGGGNVAFTSQQGRAWVRPFDDLDGIDLKKRKGSVKVAPDSTVVVGPAGTAFAISPAERTIRHIAGPAVETKRRRLSVDVTAGFEAVVVGSTPVVLAKESGKLQIGDRAVDIARYGSGARLQDGPASGDAVLVATDDQLVSVPLADGKPTVLYAKGSGQAVRPVRAGRCAFGAWTGTTGTHPQPRMVRTLCGKKQDPPIDISGGGEARFRVNGTYAVLNQLDTGRSYLLRDSSLVVIDNWAEQEDEVPTEEENPDESADGGDNECDPKAENTPPEPLADEGLGARPGVATVLDVLGNDRDADCDVLAIVGSPTDVNPPDAATIIPVDRGHSLQFTARADFTGPVTFTYEMSDGRSTPVSAKATVTVKPFEAENTEPQQIRPAKMSVGPGQTVTFNVLESFADPEGDTIYLDGADLPAGTLGTVRAEPNGTVTFVDSGSTGSFEIALRVSDGRKTGNGALAVEIVADPSPVARNDHALGLVGQPVTVEVLANDTGIAGQELTLTAADSTEPGTSVQKDTTAGLVIFTATTAGSYRIPYTIASGPKEASAFVRVDVSEPTGNLPPIAVRDTAVVVVGGTTTVDLVANDSDPNLDVLVVSSVTVPPGTGLTVQLLEHRALRISASRLPDSQPVMIGYTVTDGLSEPVGGQLQLQVQTTGRVNQPPTARDDIAVVRVGDVVTVPVLANDVDLDGDVLTVDPKVTVNVADGAAVPGLAFATPNAVRFVAGAEPGSVTISYEVTDGISGKASALVRLRIVPNGANQAPVPRSVEARTLVNGPLRINVPTFGIDPDGDVVTLALARQPSLGTAVLGEDCDACFDYTPSTGKTGTDVFTYTATDAGGLSGTATIRVGIGARTGANQPPIAVVDKVKMRPGGQVTVPVLANDSDADNDPIELLEEPLPAPDGMKAKVVGDRVQVEATDPMIATLTYQVSDGKESTPGSLTVEVTADAPPVAPVARDDAAAVPEDREKSVPVDVLANDEDQDGAMDDLSIEIDPLGASIAKVDGRRVLVTLGERPAVVPYRITDKDGLSATAVIRVPSAKVNLPPKLKNGLKAIHVDGGATAEIKLADVVEDPEGADVFLVAGGEILGDHGTATASGPATLSFVAAPDYTGAGSISFTVTDGADPTDPAGARAALSVPLEIRSETNTPPTLTGAGATVEVDGEATTVDLKSFAADPDPGDLEQLRFEGLAGMANGIEASISGSSLQVKAGKEAVKNSKLTLTLTVADAKNPPVPASVEVSVVASRKPLATVIDHEVIASSGQPKSIEALQSSQAPQGLDPLVIETAALDGGLGEVKVEGGKTVVVTPSAEFVGVANVTYTVNDSLKDPDRRVTGKIKVTVKDRPGKPQAPTVAEYGHEFVVLTWQPPDARGGTIDGYELKSADGAITKECDATTCRLTAEDGIKNDVAYTFSVRAHNEVSENKGGWSDPSDPSKTVRPDTRPNPATVGPTLTYDPALNSGELRISWPAAEKTGPWINLGSPILEYEVQLSPAPPNTAQLKVGPTTTSFVITGLINGTEYTAKVRAKNSANKETDALAGWSDYSPASNKESPATESLPPTAVTATKRDDPVASFIEVTWSKPTSINAKELLSYTILVSRDGAAETRVQATQPASSASFQQAIAADLGSTYRFRVIATNKAGESQPSSQSAGVKGFTRPRQITSVAAAATGNNTEIKLTFAAPAAEGDPIDQYQVVASPGGASFRPYANGGILMSGLINGTNYTFTVAACNQGSNTRYCGQASPATAGTSPYGPPSAPGVSASHTGGNNIRLNWSAPAPNGRPIVRSEISVDGGGWQSVAPSGSTDRNTGYSQEHCIVARSVTGGAGEPELTGPQSGRSCDTSPRRPPTNQVSLVQGPANSASGPGCAVGRCSHVVVRLTDWAPGSAHTVTMEWNDGDRCSKYVAARYPTTDGNGNSDSDTGCFVGNGYSIRAVVDGTPYPWQAVSWAR